MPTYRASTNTVDDFGPGNEVLYVPIWANGDASNHDCESGVVTTCNQSHVFVRYYHRETGNLLLTSRATNPEDLINLSEA